MERLMHPNAYVDLCVMSYSVPLASLAASTSASLASLATPPVQPSALASAATGDDAPAPKKRKKTRGQKRTEALMNGGVVRRYSLFDSFLNERGLHS
jgi:hypothetical protein